MEFPPGISAVHYMQSSKSYSHSGGAWTLARNARTFPDFRCVHSLRIMAVLSRALLSGEVAKARAKSARTSGEANLLAVSMSQPWLVCALDQSLHAAQANAYKDFGLFPFNQMSALNFRQLPVANGTAFSKISKKEDNLAMYTQISKFFSRKFSFHSFLPPTFLEF